MQGAADPSSQPLWDDKDILPAADSEVSNTPCAGPAARWGGAAGVVPGPAPALRKCPGGAWGSGTHPLSTRKESRQTLIFFFK